MATWGTGLFSSDSAQDFLEDLAELSMEERFSEIERVIFKILEDPASLMREVFPETVIAASALVALSLPGGTKILDTESSFVAEAASEASLDRPAPELAPNALRAIAAATSQNGPWRKNWRHQGDQEEAVLNISMVKEILGSINSN